MTPELRFLIALGALIALASTIDWAYWWTSMKRRQDHTPHSPLYDRFKRRHAEMREPIRVSRAWQRDVRRTPDEAA